MDTFVKYFATQDSTCEFEEGKNHHAGISWQGRATKGNCSAVKAKRIYKVTLFYSSYWRFPLSDPTETCDHRHQRHLRDVDFCWPDLVEKREWDWTRKDRRRRFSLHSVFGEASFLRLLVGLLCHQASVGILTCFHFGNLLSYQTQSGYRYIKYL